MWSHVTDSNMISSIPLVIYVTDVTLVSGTSLASKAVGGYHIWGLVTECRSHKKLVYIGVFRT